MERKKEVLEELKTELEQLTGKKVSQEEASEAAFNLAGFLKVLMKMKKEEQDEQ